MTQKKPLQKKEEKLSVGLSALQKIKEINDDEDFGWKSLLENE